MLKKNKNQNQATIIFKGELNDFLKNKNSKIVCEFTDNHPIKDLVESIGPPHPEIALIYADGKSVEFDFKVNNKSMFIIFPHQYNNEISEKKTLPSIPQGKPLFILDVHLGTLARYLRMAGFDTLYNNEDWGDEYIAERAGAENRIVLTRDIGLLKRSVVVYGRWLRNTDPKKQFSEVVKRFRLSNHFELTTRCTKCNNFLISVPKEEIIEMLEEQTKKDYNEFWKCYGCNQIYWKGSHYDKIAKFLTQ
jgi:hypothetical protein